MTTRITNKTKDFLLKVSLPERTKSYTPISHEFAINEITNNLLANNFIVKEERYRSTANGKIANGVFELNRNDNDMQMICCFSNSYDKSTRFSIAIGAKVIETGNYFISDIKWIRKHSGTADSEAKKEIASQISNANNYFNKLHVIKSHMENINCSNKQYGSVIGQLYINGLISTEQISECYTQWKRMEIDNDVDSANLWTAFNFVLKSLQKSHPAKWLQNTIFTTMYVLDMFNIKVNNEQTELNFDDENNEVEATEVQTELQLNESESAEEESEIIEFEDNEETEPQETTEEPNSEEIIEEQTIQQETEEEKVEEEKEETEEVIVETPIEEPKEVIEEQSDEIVEEPVEELVEESIDESVEERNDEVIEQNEESTELENEEINIVEEDDNNDFVPFMVTDEGVLNQIESFLVSNGINDAFIAFDEGNSYKVTTSSQTIEITKDVL